MSPETREMLRAASVALSRGTTKTSIGPPGKRPGKRVARGETRDSPNKVRWAMLNRFVDVRMKSLPAAACSVWLVLFRHADATGHVSMALPQLQEKCGVSRNTVRSALKALEEVGLLTIERKGNNVGGIYETSVYKLERQGSKIDPIYGVKS